MRKHFVTLLLSACVAAASSASAQVVHVVADGLVAPLKLLALENGTILVAEAGRGPNQGRVSAIDRNRGRTTLIDQLPGGLHWNGGASGPSGLLVQGARLYILIGNGDSVLAGPAQGSEIPNPNISSPLMSSLLAAEFDMDGTGLTGGFSLPRDAHDLIAQGEVVTLFNARGQRCRLWRVADFPNYLPEPRPDSPANVRVANPFGLVGNQSRIDVVDASRNLIWQVTPGTGEVSILARFPPVPSAVQPGPPVVDAVPATLRAWRDDLLVSYLTGFPFGAGAAHVGRVDRHTGAHEAVVTGLQTAVDVLPVNRGRGRFYVLEHSANFLAGAPGRLLRIDQEGNSPTVLATGLRAPVNMDIDPLTGDILVLEHAANRLVLVQIPR